MKRYERMSKEEIISLFVKIENGCNECPLSPIDVTKCSPATCNSDVAEYLNKEIKTKKVRRFTLLKTAEDVDKTLEVLSNYCNEQDDCAFCKYRVGDIDVCFANYLKEEIEVEEE